MSRQLKTLVWAASVIVGIWLVAMTGYFVAKNLKVTADKVRAYVESVDFSKLSGDARARAIQKLADMLNNLSPEERRQMRLERLAERWFVQMTEEEKGAF